MSEMESGTGAVDSGHEADADTDPHAPAVAVSGTDRKNGGGRRVMKTVLYLAYEMPLFIFLLLVFCLIKLIVEDMRGTFMEVGAYAFTWVELFYALSAFIALGEIYKISEPGKRNTKEAILILGAAIVYLVLFLLAAAQVAVLEDLFNNSEFLVMTAIAWAGAIIALIINPRTAQRAIHGGGE